MDTNDLPTPVASPAQCRAARGLLGWTQQMLAQRASVARKTVVDFELGNRALHRRTRHEITAALRAANVDFIWGPEGEGVRLANGHATPQVVNGESFAVKHHSAREGRVRFESLNSTTSNRG